jgi:hypothetical protein
MNVLALVKNSERYVFLYDDDSTESVLQKLGQYAADEELSFSWYDAAVLSQKVRRLKEETIAKTSAVPSSSAPSSSSITSAPASAVSQPEPDARPESVPLPGLRFRSSGRFLP